MMITINNSTSRCRVGASEGREVFMLCVQATPTHCAKSLSIQLSVTHSCSCLEEPPGLNIVIYRCYIGLLFRSHR